MDSTEPSIYPSYQLLVAAAVDPGWVVQCVHLPQQSPQHPHLVWQPLCRHSPCYHGDVAGPICGWGTRSVKSTAQLDSTHLQKEQPFEVIGYHVFFICHSNITQWCLAMHQWAICITGSGNGLSPVQCQAVTLANADFKFSITPKATYFSRVGGGEEVPTPVR